MVAPDRKNDQLKFPVAKFTTYGDHDYDFLTKRHLPINQWQNGLDELYKAMEELKQQSPKAAKLDEPSLSGSDPQKVENGQEF